MRAEVTHTGQSADVLANACLADGGGVDCRGHLRLAAASATEPRESESRCVFLHNRTRALCAAHLVF
jgi:hypothetical protein